MLDAATERSRARSTGVALALALVAPIAATAATLDGAVRLNWTRNDLGAFDTSSADRSANLAIDQVLTPYLRLRLYGNYGEQIVKLDDVETSSRRSLQPTAEVAYNRPGLSWRVGWEHLNVDSSSIEQQFESNSLVGNLQWQPRESFRLGLGYRDARNQSDDVAALGRDLEQRQGHLDALFQRRYWSLGYTASYNELTGGSSALDIEQLRQDVRLYASRVFARDRLRLSFSGTGGRLEATEKRGSDGIGEPLPPLQGLAAIDPTPAIGELAPAPGLVDGSTTVPTAPPIEIGGANTFRNVGLDLGLPRPATRLEIAVDRASGPDVVWEAYQSADGMFWDPVPVLARSWDADLLRYTLRVAETSQRYLKAVNVTVNPADDVRVTEVRALREVAELQGPEERNSDLYQLAASLGWRMSRRVTFDAGAEAANDSTTVGGVVRRDYETSGFRAGVQVEMTPELRLALRYRHNESEEKRQGGLVRSSDDVAASLRWNPLATVDASLTTGYRTDDDALVELSKTQFGRFGLSLDLLDELRLVTDLSASRLEGAGIATQRDTLSWTERIEMRPRKHWRVSGGYNWSRTDNAAGDRRLYENSGVFVDFDWTPGNALTLHGNLTYYDQSTGTTLRQSYGLSWLPGPKLSVAVGWDEFEEQNGLLTGNDSIALNYELTHRIQLFASLVRSRTDLGDGTESDVTSVNAGTSISF